ncbi:hypothetical protein NDU88_004179 [Pleurodeles waltl]|uniref:Uncharacterized protein n=1 Tax=Pleurodeles waltl TaxID=8319 RepID=A0AAV7W7N3_PLEWA|nr:hypothetical protein NDU88_004179 [Pleurodeles waltl]
MRLLPRPGVLVIQWEPSNNRGRLEQQGRGLAAQGGSDESFLPVVGRQWHGAGETKNLRRGIDHQRQPRHPRRGASTRSGARDSLGPRR